MQLFQNLRKIQIVKHFWLQTFWARLFKLFSFCSAGPSSVRDYHLIFLWWAQDITFHLLQMARSPASHTGRAVWQSDWYSDHDSGFHSKTPADPQLPIPSLVREHMLCLCIISHSDTGVIHLIWNAWYQRGLKVWTFLNCGVFHMHNELFWGWDLILNTQCIYVWYILAVPGLRIVLSSVFVWLCFDWDPLHQLRHAIFHWWDYMTFKSFRFRNILYFKVWC